MSELYKGEQINRDFKGKDILSIEQFNNESLGVLYDEVDATVQIVESEGGTDLLKWNFLATNFYEASTRTEFSFRFAMLRHGGSVDGPSDKMQYSSVSKGESLQDTAITFEQYADAIVMRHPQVGAVAVAASETNIPVINGGDGTGEHPTQALLDLYTIKKKMGKIDGLNITLLGDLKNGRTVHSLAKLLAKYDTTINYVSPAELAMPKQYIEQLGELGIQQYESTTLEDCLPTSDVLYVTRVQGERFLDQADYHRLKDHYRITPEVLEKAKDDMIVMHPLPRTGEITREVDADPRVAYFDQMKYGMYVRMGLLALVLGKTVQQPVNDTFLLTEL
jgi:aspartate carbamoyltransferase